MEQLSNLYSDLGAAKEALGSGDLRLAVTLSGEVLASADSLWSSAFNSHEPTGDAIRLFASAAALHCMSLLFASENSEAFKTSLMSMFQISYDGVEDSGVDESRLGLSSVVVTSFLCYLQNCPVSEDEQVREHVQTIARYLFSLHYYLYNKVIKESPQSEYLQFGYSVLRDNMEHIPVEYPAVNVNGVEVDLESPLSLFSDLLGRVKAIGLV